MIYVTLIIKELIHFFVELHDTYKYSFYPQTIELWNNLPLQIADSPSFSSFQNLLHKYIVFAK